MTGAEYRELRKRAGLTARELGELVGVDGNTVMRRERDELPIHRESELAVQFVTASRIASPPRARETRLTTPPRDGRWRSP